jgi:hypothetical protein
MKHRQTGKAPQCYLTWEGRAGEGLPAQHRRIVFANFSDSAQRTNRLAIRNFHDFALPRANPGQAAVTAPRQPADRVDSIPLQSLVAIRSLDKGYPLFPAARNPLETPPRLLSGLQPGHKIFGASLPTKRIDRGSPGSF